jgi:ribosomal protein L16/L10AE
VCARVRAGAVVLDVGASLSDLAVVRDRLRIASMKISSPCSIVVTKYKNPELFKQSGLPLYDDKKRREVPMFEFVAA